MTSVLPEDVATFVARLRERLEVGARQYGDSSFRRPATDLLDEIQAELCDVAGWGLLLWVRIERLRERAARLDAAGGGA
jgi:hypothetical protein